MPSAFAAGDTVRPARLLRASGQWQTRRCTADEGDELASLHRGI
jgi:hypothetical protein